MTSRALVFLSIFIWTPLPLLSAQDEADKNLSVAESQHEIVMLLIEKKEFGKVFDAAKKIFDLPFAEEQEPLLVREAALLTDALLVHKQSVLAHRVLDAALGRVVGRSSKAKLHREKAYVFKEEGKPDEAMRHFEQAVELEKEGGS